MAAVEQRIDPGSVRLLDEVVRLATESRAFASVQRRGASVHCVALTNEEAAYEATSEADGVFVAWVSPNRYLSQSIEADLMWTGDDLMDLIEEELADEGCTDHPLGRIEHFRDAEKRFTFRSRVRAGADAALVVKCLVALAKTFSQLGDMKDEE
ncbi:MAG: hypothetical protein JNK58_01330 [Phycisphaerae bacterium]|nr:hypothetical protein [Phycisphaerae bacterium]